MDSRELLDRKAERVRWKIAHAFAQWATRAAIQSQGGNNLPKKQEYVNRYLGTVEFDSLFDMSKGTIEKDEFNKWHRKQVNRLQQNYHVLNYGWAAKMIAVYLKTTCYLAGFGRDGLDTVIHPPFDRILMEKMGMKKMGKSPGIKDIDEAFYWEELIETCKRIAKQKKCTLFEVEQLWRVGEGDSRITDLSCLTDYKIWLNPRGCPG